jgi:hypothetical protein
MGWVDVPLPAAKIQHAGKVIAYFFLLFPAILRAIARA